MTTDHTEDTEGDCVEEDKVLYRKESHLVLGACFSVYREKGCGFLEPVYHDCLAIEFRHQSIPHVHEPLLRLSYRDELLKHAYSPDFVCFEKIIVELKAVTKLIDEHRAQLLNYLRASKLRVGYLANFGHYPRLEYERFIV